MASDKTHIKLLHTKQSLNAAAEDRELFFTACPILYYRYL